MGKFTGSEGSFISILEAKAKTKRHRNRIANTTINTKAFFFGGQKVKEILDQPGCVGIRVYYGENLDGSPELVMVGTDENQLDLTTGKILDRAICCPPFCPVNPAGRSSLAED